MSTSAFRLYQFLHSTELALCTSDFLSDLTVDHLDVIASCCGVPQNYYKLRSKARKIDFLINHRLVLATCKPYDSLGASALLVGVGAATVSKLCALVGIGSTLSLIDQSYALLTYRRVASKLGSFNAQSLHHDMSGAAPSTIQLSLGV